MKANDYLIVVVTWYFSAFWFLCATAFFFYVFYMYKRENNENIESWYHDTLLEKQTFSIGWIFHISETCVQFMWGKKLNVVLQYDIVSSPKYFL